MQPHGSPVPPKSLAAALDHLAQGGRLAIPTAYRCTVIELRHVQQWEAHGGLLREDGEGYRMRQGKGSVYLLPGQLRFVDGK
jgi:hypothetical protein